MILNRIQRFNTYFKTRDPTKRKPGHSVFLENDLCQVIQSLRDSI